MFRFKNRRRRAHILALAAVAAGIAVPAAAAQPGMTSGSVIRYLDSNVALTPDLAPAPVSDVLSSQRTYRQLHGVGSAGTLAAATQSTPYVPSPPRNPVSANAVISAAAGVQPQTTDVLTPQSSFHWGDAGVGVGVGIGAALVAFATGLVMLRRRDRLVF